MRERASVLKRAQFYHMAALLFPDGSLRKPLSSGEMEALYSGYIQQAEPAVQYLYGARGREAESVADGVLEKAKEIHDIDNVRASRMILVKRFTIGNVEIANGVNVYQKILITNLWRMAWLHSPDGFEIGFETGYAGSGQADLALNLTEHALNLVGYKGPREAVYGGWVFKLSREIHQAVKRALVAPAKRDGLSISIARLLYVVVREAEATIKDDRY